MSNTPQISASCGRYPDISEMSFARIGSSTFVYMVLRAVGTGLSRPGRSFSDRMPASRGPLTRLSYDMVFYFCGHGCVAFAMLQATQPGSSRSLVLDGQFRGLAIGHSSFAAWRLSLQRYRRGRGHHPGLAVRVVGSHLMHTSKAKG